jgi:SAM-dependent methyltransferase
LTKLFVRRRKRYVAADIDRVHLDRLAAQFEQRPNFETRWCDLNCPDHFSEFVGRLDTVICLNVLEHVEDDMAGLRSIHSVLKPGGRAIVLVPCGRELFGTLDTALGHYRRYSWEELSEKMAQTGFIVDHVLNFNKISRPAWYVSGKILKRTVLNPGQLRLFDQFVWLWRWLDPLLPWGPTSIIAIGSKRTQVEIAGTSIETTYTDRTDSAFTDRATSAGKIHAELG